MKIQLAAILTLLLASAALAQQATTQSSGLDGIPPTPVAPVLYPERTMLSPAGIARLSAERRAMAQELLDNAVWDPDEIKRQVEILNRGEVADTYELIKRFADACEKLHPPFADAYKLYKDGKWNEAADAFEKLLFKRTVLIKAKNAHDTLPPFQYSIAKFMQAECLARRGSLKDAIVAYQVVFQKMPEALTLAAASRHRAALIYETTDRVHFATPMLEDNLRLHGRLFTDAHRAALEKTIADYNAKDPFLIAQTRVHEISRRITNGDTSEQTQQLQKELMAMLARMLVLAEEEGRQFLEHTDAIGTGAESGKLEKGGTPMLNPLGADPSKTGPDDWGQLRPREKQQLIEAFKAAYPDRYRDMVEAYYRNISDKETNTTNSGGR